MPAGHRIALAPDVAAATFLKNHDLADEAKNKELVSLMVEVAASAVRTALGVDNDKLSLAEVLQEITGSRPEDNIAPGLQLAWLADKGIYYAAVHTFPMGTVDSRQVVAKATGADLTTAMVKCLASYRSTVRR